MYGFYRIGTANIYTQLSEPSKNLSEVLKLVDEAVGKRFSTLLFPELTLSGYSLNDIFYQETLYKAQNFAIETLVKRSETVSMVIVIGAYINYLDRLYNCAVVIQSGEILGIVPKSYVPNRGEFYEKRHFNSGRDIKGVEIEFLGRVVPFGVDLLFGDGDYLLFGVELCEDLWAVTPPSLAMCESGAVVILNLSASNELIGKAEYRESLVSSQSARGVCAYIYSSSGVGESSTDTIFGGDLIIAEYGSTLSRAERFTLNSQLISADVDLFRLKALRIREGTFADSIPKNFRRVPLKPLPRIERVERYIDPHPFVPKDRENLNRRAEEIIKIQAHSLIKRVLSADIQKAMIGVSGGLDSTLALLVTHFAFKTIKRSSKDIVAVLMPSFGTTDRTFNNALNLCKALDVSYKTISIKELVLKEFELIGHNPDSYDTTYENVQARVRTSILMNIANREGGLVVGTGDLSEIALGWSTYNGDQMSMYGINSSIPKTLIKYLIEYFALSDGSGRLREVLEDILDTPISPELLPPNGKEISQKTEEIIGPYELHDFFLYHFIRYGTSPDRLFYLSTIAFGDRYDKNTVKKWLKLFIKRFFTQQFKRSSMPDGVKVGTISLSPRADWRMPSDASFKEWLRIVDDL